MKDKSFIGKPIEIPTGSVFINPGSGPVNGAKLENAHENIKYLIIDIGLDPDDIVTTHYPEYDEDGRFYFELEYKGCRCDIMMPGLPLNQVRYMGENDQNIWDFPRLYVEGSSWVWMYAIRCVNGVLLNEDD